VQTNPAAGQTLTRLSDLHFSSGPLGLVRVIHVDDRVSYQRVTGFGGAMTDSAAWLLHDELAPATRERMMDALFGSDGIKLDFLRVPMGASDFTAKETPYSYDDLPAGKTDPTLSHFSISHDEAYIIPTLREALAINPHLEIMANPWSPPAWMKANDSLNNSGYSGTLVGSAYGPLAAYFVKFIEAYAHAGIPIDDISPQNEPGVATLYPGLELTAIEEERLVTDFLAPALAAARLHPRIYGHDLGFSRDYLGLGFAKALLHTQAVALLHGIAWHCYRGNPQAISTIHGVAPSLDEIADECAPGVNPMPVPEEIIAQLRNWARVVVLWSLALDPRGGPVQPPNRGCGGCTGLITVDEQTGEATLGPTYFELGQASAFVAPGARRIASEHFVAYRYGEGRSHVTDGIDDVALENPDGSIVLIAYNTSSSELPLGVRWRRRGFTYTLPAGAMVTFVWNRAGR